MKGSGIDKGSGARRAGTAFLCEAMAGTDASNDDGEFGRDVFLLQKWSEPIQC